MNNQMRMMMTMMKPPADNIQSDPKITRLPTFQSNLTEGGRCGALDPDTRALRDPVAFMSFTSSLQGLNEEDGKEIGASERERRGRE